MSYSNRERRKLQRKCRSMGLELVRPKSFRSRVKRIRGRGVFEGVGFLLSCDPIVLAPKVTVVVFQT